MGHYGGAYKVTYDLYKKYGEMRLLDTPICGACAGRIHSASLGILEAWQLVVLVRAAPSVLAGDCILHPADREGRCCVNRTASSSW